jgi:hypothetical protein
MSAFHQPKEASVPEPVPRRETAGGVVGHPSAQANLAALGDMVMNATYQRLDQRRAEPAATGVAGHADPDHRREALPARQYVYQAETRGRAVQESHPSQLRSQVRIPERLLERVGSLQGVEFRSETGP